MRNGPIVPYTRHTLLPGASSLGIRHSIKHPRMHIGAVHCRMAPRAPTRPLAQKRSVIHLANINLSASNAWTLILRVAFQAQVRIIFDQHLAIDGTMRVVANGAAFA